MGFTSFFIGFLIGFVLGIVFLGYLQIKFRLNLLKMTK